MDPKEFISSLQEYYGMTYTSGEAKVIGPWITGKTKSYLGELFNQVVRSHQKALRSLPDMAVFDECGRKVWDVLSQAPMITKTPVRALIEGMAEGNAGGDEAMQGLVDHMERLKANKSRRVS